MPSPHEIVIHLSIERTEIIQAEHVRVITGSDIDERLRWIVEEDPIGVRRTGEITHWLRIHLQQQRDGTIKRLGRIERTALPTGDEAFRIDEIIEVEERHGELVLEQLRAGLGTESAV